MTAIEPTATLGELVARRPARASLFEHLGLDYCCGGHQTLAQACARAGLDPPTLARTIQALDDDPADALAQGEDVDWRTTPLGDLCDHIVCAHHDRLRRELPEIDELLDSVMRVHGPTHLELRRLPPAFARLRGELEFHIACRTHRRLLDSLRALEHDLHQHIHKENNIPFPRMRAAMTRPELVR